LKTIVTGGAGFIGSNLVDKLTGEGHEVTVLDNLSTGQLENLKQSKNNIKFINIDLSKQTDELKDIFKNSDWIFHLAGLADIVPSIIEPKKYFNSNVAGTINVLEAARVNNIKSFIYAASASCYGIPKNYPTPENSQINTQYPYALTKYLGESLVMHYAKVYKMPNTSLRFFNVYGPRSRTKGAYGAVFGVFLAQKLSNKPLTIVGDGKQTRDFIHVYDLVEAIFKVAKKTPEKQIYNLGSGKEISVNKIAELIGGEKIYIPKRPGEPDRSCADIGKIKADLMWEPKMNIEDGVKTLLDTIDNWKEAPVWTPEKIQIATQEWFKVLDKKNNK
jgi:UDP-glucose 4-epimerase